MTIPVSELEKPLVLPSRHYKFIHRLKEQQDGKGNLGLNACLSYQYLEVNIWREPIRIEVDPLIEWNGHIPYSFQFLPPIERSLLAPRLPAAREFPIIRIVAAPGVNIYLPPDAKKVGLLSISNPKVEIIRVQDVGLIPPLGRDIYTQHFVNTKWINPDDPTPEPAQLALLPQHKVRVETKHNGVDIVQEMFHTKLVVRVKTDDDKTADNKSKDDRFLYKFIRQSGRTFLIFMITESVKVKFQKVGVAPFQSIRDNLDLDSTLNDNRQIKIKYLRVPNLFAFNRLAEYFFLEDFPKTPEGRIVLGSAPIPPKRISTGENIIDQLIVDVGIGLIPVVGDLYDLAQFVYGVTNGTDVHGNKVSSTELIVMGLCALLPAISYGLVRAKRSSKKALEAFGQKAEVIEELASQTQLDSKGKKLLEEASSILAKGGKLPDKLINDIMNTVELPSGKFYIVDDLLDASKSNFTFPELQEKYQVYLAAKRAEKGKEIKPPLTPEQWVKSTRKPEAIRVLEFLLGKEFRKTSKAASQGKFSYINASEVIRPSSLDDVRLKQFIQRILADIDDAKKVKETPKLFQKIPSNEIVNGKISKELFDILKGNIGEILAKEYKEALLKARRAEFGDSVELFENVRIVVKKDNTGKFTEEFWEFTDGIIGGFNKDGDFVIKDIIEVKAGSSVANKVQKQIFEWVEDKISEGAIIALQDGRKFEYFPSSNSNFKRVIGLANARRHAINPLGKSHLGMSSSQQIAADVKRLELPADSEEIKFLTALIANTDEVPLKITTKVDSEYQLTHAELDYLVAELAQRISAHSNAAP